MSQAEMKPEQSCKLPKFYSNSRELRNEAERQRRERLNRLVSQLGKLVPFVSQAEKKVDKTSVLRLAVAYLRLNQIKDYSEQTLNHFPTTASSDRILKSVFEAVGGFFLVLTCSGKVVYTSDAIEKTFHYTQSDVLGRCFLSMVHREDVGLVQSELQPKGDPNRRSFYCRLLKKNGSVSDSSSYEIVHVMGQLKKNCPSKPDNEGPPTNTIDPRRKPSGAISKVKDVPCSSSPSTSIGGGAVAITSGLSHIFLAFVEVVRDRPITELSWVESMRDEYITRHKLDGSIVYTDHRISFVTGWMPQQVYGRSAFEFIFNGDLLQSLVAQVQMQENPQGQGFTAYRLRCKDDSHVCLHSRGYLEINKRTGLVDSFICINTVISKGTLEKELEEQRKKLLPITAGKSTGEIVEELDQKIPANVVTFLRGFMKEGTLSYPTTSCGSMNSDSSVDTETIPAPPSPAAAASEHDINPVKSNDDKLATSKGSNNFSTPASVQRPCKKKRRLESFEASVSLTCTDCNSSSTSTKVLPLNFLSGPKDEEDLTESSIFQELTSLHPIRPHNKREPEVELALESGKQSFVEAFPYFEPSYLLRENWGYPANESFLPPKL